MLEKVLDLCKRNNISMTLLERELGFGRGTIAKWTKSSPGFDKIEKVAEYFGVSTDYFRDKKE